MRAAAVIPAFRERERVGAVVAGARRHLPEGAVLVIDDGSADGTAEAAERAGARVFRQAVNAGKGAALRRGYEEALAMGFDAVVFLDADGQHDPASIPAFLHAAEEGGDLVLGTRMGAVGSMPPLRLWTNRFTSWVVSRLAGWRVTDSQCGYRLAHARLLLTLDLRGARYDAESEMVVKAGRRGFRIVEIPIETIYGGETSKIRPLVDSGRFVRMVWRSRKWR